MLRVLKLSAKLIGKIDWRKLNTKKELINKYLIYLNSSN